MCILCVILLDYSPDILKISIQKGISSQVCWYRPGNPNTQKVDGWFKANLVYIARLWTVQTLSQKKIQESQNSQRQALICFGLVIGCWFYSCPEVCDRLS